MYVYIYIYIYIYYTCNKVHGLPVKSEVVSPESKSQSEVVLKKTVLVQ